MLSSKKGAAILQVLLLAAVLAGIATMLLRFAVGRTASARHNRRMVAGQLAIQSCMAEVNEIWVDKSPEAFERDMNECIFNCKSGDAGFNNPSVPCSEENREREYKCVISTFDGNDSDHAVTATISGTNGDCEITYSLPNAESL